MGLFSKATDVELTVKGMTCGNCEAHVVNALKGVPGVKDASADTASESAHAKVKGEVDRDALVAAVVAAGYEAS